MFTSEPRFVHQPRGECSYICSTTRGQRTLYHVFKAFVGLSTLERFNHLCKLPVVSIRSSVCWTSSGSVISAIDARGFANEVKGERLRPLTCVGRPVVYCLLITGLSYSRYIHSLCAFHSSMCVVISVVFTLK